MDALISKAIEDTTALRKTSVPWVPDEPYAQSYYAFDPATSSWIARSPSKDGKNEQSAAINNIALYSWNIDFMLPFEEARMKAALSHLDSLTSSKSRSPTVATVIFLQECKPEDLTTIAATPWVRERFYLSDVDHTNWATTHYGTTILIDSRLPITSAFRVHYSKTRMDRDALFVDVSLRPDGKKIRLCTSHLESMAFDPPFRPAQMQLIARYLHDDSVHGGIASGDFNAIQLFDRTLHVDNNNNLKDAYLELGGKEDTEEGYTWGQQAATELRAKFGCSRMDKVYFCGCLKTSTFGRFGNDVLVEGDEMGKGIVALGFEKPWVTDHLGVKAELEVLPENRRSDLRQWHLVNESPSPDVSKISCDTIVKVTVGGLYAQGIFNDWVDVLDTHLDKFGFLDTRLLVHKKRKQVFKGWAEDYLMVWGDLVDLFAPNAPVSWEMWMEMFSNGIKETEKDVVVHQGRIMTAIGRKG